MKEFEQEYEEFQSISNKNKRKVRMNSLKILHNNKKLKKREWTAKLKFYGAKRD